MLAVIEPKYPSSGYVGREPIGVDRMLRMHFAGVSSPDRRQQVGLDSKP
jgi:hypothetical protein